MLRAAGLFVLVLGLALLASCRGPGDGTAPEGACPRDLSPAAAAQDAARDVRDGRAVIYVAGTIALYEPGIDAANRGWVASLPRSYDLPTGCTEPRAAEAARYAAAYNRTVAAACSGR